MAGQAVTVWRGNFQAKVQEPCPVRRQVTPIKFFCLVIMCNPLTFCRINHKFDSILTWAKE